MKRNGEYKEYSKYRISKEIEHQWSHEVKESLVDRILNGTDYLAVVQLANVDLPQKDIMDSFHQLSQTPNKDIILSTIKRMSVFFDADVYNTIIGFFD